MAYSTSFQQDALGDDTENYSEDKQPESWCDDSQPTDIS